MLNQSHLQRRRRCRAHSERRRDEQVAFGLSERTAFTCGLAFFPACILCETHKMAISRHNGTRRLLHCV